LLVSQLAAAGVVVGVCAVVSGAAGGAEVGAPVAVEGVEGPVARAPDAVRAEDAAPAGYRAAAV